MSGVFILSLDTEIAWGTYGARDVAARAGCFDGYRALIRRLLDVLDRHGHEQFKHMYPYDEIRTMKWNGNPYNVSGGSDGREEQAPWPYLMPYWMMRYYGAIR